MLKKTCILLSLFLVPGTVDAMNLAHKWITSWVGSQGFSTAKPKKDLNPTFTDGTTFFAGLPTEIKQHIIYMLTSREALAFLSTGKNLCNNPYIILPLPHTIKLSFYAKDDTAQHPAIVRFVNLLAQNRFDSTNPLRWNAFDIDHGRKVVNALIKNNTLTDITLIDTILGDEAAPLLSHWLQANSTLKSFTLACRNSKNATIPLAIASTLSHNTTLTALSMGSYDITIDAAGKLAKALVSNSTLKTLKLNNNNISDSALCILLEGLEKNCTLTELDLSNNKLTDQNGQKIGYYLASNSSMTSLNLANYSKI